MQVGDYVRSRFGDIGKIVQITTLNDLAEGEESGPVEEGDLPYLVCEKEDGQRFEICEYEAELITDIMKRAILKGNVRISKEGEEVLAAMNPHDPERFTITDVKLDCWGPYKGNKSGFCIHWVTKAAGFGSMTVYVDNDGKLKCDNEAMGKNFLKTVLVALLDKMELDDGLT